MNSRISPVFLFFFSITRHLIKSIFLLFPRFCSIFFFSFFSLLVFHFLSSFLKVFENSNNKKMFFSMYSATYLLELDIYRRIYTPTVYNSIHCGLIASARCPLLDWITCFSFSLFLTKRAADTHTLREFGHLVELRNDGHRLWGQQLKESLGNTQDFGVGHRVEKGS